MTRHDDPVPRLDRPVHLDAPVYGCAPASEWPAASMAAVVSQLSDLRRELQDHVEKEEGQWARWDEAFPEGDSIGHRHAHEAMMKAASAEERFWSELRLDIAKKGLWGLLILILGLATAGFYSHFGSRP